MSLTLKDASLLKEQMYVNGDWIEATNQSRVTILDPATQQVVGQVAFGGANEAIAAVDAAHAAFPTWRALLPAERAAILKRWHAALLNNIDDLARIVTLEQGKPLADARGEVLYGASFLEFYAEEATRVHGSVLSMIHADRRNFVTREPIGVVGAITPWNFPSVLVARKLAPALAAGCTMVLKPAPQTPFSALALAELGYRAGLPKGVFNVVIGEAKPIGDVLTSDRRVRKISFTGSARTGIQLLQQSAPTVKKVSLELGGNAPFIVFDDADLRHVIPQAIFSKFRNGGQTCSCTNRFLVQSGIKHRFVEALVEATRSLRVGPGADPATDIGPLIDDSALNRVVQMVEDARVNGANVLVGGKVHERGGNFYEPTVIDRVSQMMALMQQEIFGPVAPIMTFQSEEEAVAIANETEFGLAAYFFTGDPGRIFRVSERLEAGVVGANTAMASNAFVPFGGVKQSGIGREGGKYGIDEYLEIKLTSVGAILE